MGDADLERDLLSPPGKWPISLYDCCNSDNKDVHLFWFTFPLLSLFLAKGSTTILSCVLSYSDDMVYFFLCFLSFVFFVFSRLLAWFSFCPLPFLVRTHLLEEHILVFIMKNHAVVRWDQWGFVYVLVSFLLAYTHQLEELGSIVVCRII
jgi:hypothetical protein